MSAHASAPGIHLETLVLDETKTAEQTTDCLKVLKLVLKNLADPIKAQDAKYRQLKLDNPKIQQKLVPCGAALDYLKAIGFLEGTQDEIAVLRLDSPNVAVMQASLQAVTNALDMAAPITTTTTSLTKKPRRQEEEEKKSDDRPPFVAEKPSEKQKARLLMEEKEKREKEEARKHRAKNVALIKQDKYVRKHDENWKSGVSAAMAKTGEDIATFRDRHGES